MSVKKRKTIDKNTELLIKNNTHGMFYWESPNKSTIIFLENHGDEEFVTYGELKTMLSQMRTYLMNMGVIIAEVVDGDELTILDVAEGLRINKTYEDYFKSVADLDLGDVTPETTIDPEDLEIFTQESDEGDFRKALKTNMRKPLIETAVTLYKRNDLNDYNKMTAITETRSGDSAENFWNDINSTLEQ